MRVVIHTGLGCALHLRVRSKLVPTDRLLNAVLAEAQLVCVGLFFSEFNVRRWTAVVLLGLHACWTAGQV